MLKYKIYTTPSPQKRSPFGFYYLYSSNHNFFKLNYFFCFVKNQAVDCRPCYILIPTTSLWPLAFLGSLAAWQRFGSYYLGGIPAQAHHLLNGVQFLIFGQFTFRFSRRKVYLIVDKIWASWWTEPKTCYWCTQIVSSRKHFYSKSDVSIDTI